MIRTLRLGLAPLLLALSQNAVAQPAEQPAEATPSQPPVKLDSKGLFNPSTGISEWLWDDFRRKYGAVAYAPAYHPYPRYFDPSLMQPEFAPGAPPATSPAFPEPTLLIRVPANEVGFYNGTDSKLAFSARFDGADRIIEMKAKELTTIACGACGGEMTASIRTGADASTSKSMKLEGGKLYWLVQQSGLWDIVSR